MIQFNVNRPANSIFILVILLLSGCAQQSSKSIRVTPIEKPPVVSTQLNTFRIAPPKTAIKQQIVATAPAKKVITPPKDAWERLLKLYALPEYNNARVDRELDWYIKHPDYLDRIQQRAAPYLYLILNEVENKGLPGELALLPIIESAFLPHAYSRSKAAGLWQFIPPTGRMFGLKQNWWYDGRRDIYSSTKAATTYLRQLADLFDGDWLLALASYNAGKGRVAKAIKVNRQRHRATDYWSLRLPRETMAYVPKLLAVAKVFANAEKYHIKLRPIPNKPVFEAVNIGSQLDLNKAAEMAAISTDDLFLFNPGHKRWHSDPNGPHRLLIPVEKVDIFKTNLANLPKKDRMQWRRHKIKSGENLILIARKHQTSVPAIRAANKLPNNIIRAGRHLLIPVTHHPKKRHPFQPKSPVYRSGSFTHIVKRGDTFWDIARKYSVSSKKIAAWNNLGIRSTLRPGQKLVIHKSKQAQRSPASSKNVFRSVNYTVRKGDSLFDISRKFNVTIADLRKWNGDRMGKYLQPGQRLKVKVDLNQPAT